MKSKYKSPSRWFFRFWRLFWLILCSTREKNSSLPLKPLQFRLTPVQNNANWCTYWEPLFRVQLESITIGGHIKNRPGFLSHRQPHIPVSSANFSSWTQLSHRVVSSCFPIEDNRNLNSANRLPFINRFYSDPKLVNRNRKVLLTRVAIFSWPFPATTGDFLQLPSIFINF